jgi:regulation of enolase protein 1 (concanavalin A-like superfamily)
VHVQSQSGWTSGDVGNPAVAGASSLANGTFTVTGGGSDIWGRADQFQFVYQPVAGDVEIVARVASLSAAEPWAKAGVMIRQSLASGSPHVAMLGTAGNGWTAESRESSDGLTTYISGPGGAPPGWVRLVRAGNLVTASHSYDGNSWSVVSSDAIALGSTVYVGLAVTSHNSDGATARATFQNVTVRAPTSGVTPPPTPTGPTRVVFVPSADHATVTSYVVSMRGAGQSTSGAPVATRDLGKPSPVNGEISIDISTLVDPLPTGSYYAVVSATGPGGTSPSTPSPTFAK